MRGCRGRGKGKGKGGEIGEGEWRGSGGALFQAYIALLEIALARHGQEVQ